MTLIPGEGGAFEITVNGQKIYSKKQTGAFPDPEKIVRMVREMR